MAITYPEKWAYKYDNSPAIGEIWYGNGIWEKPVGGGLIWTFIPEIASGGKWKSNRVAEICDLSTYAYSAGTDPAPLGYGWNWQLEWGTTTGTYYHDYDGWKTNVVDVINNQVSWIWGDVYGGLGIEKYGTGYRFLATYGLVQSETDPDSYKILADLSNTSYALEDLIGGAFAWYTNVTGKQDGEYVGSCSSGVYWVNKNRADVNSITYYTYSMTDYQNGWIIYEQHQNASLYDTLNDNWSSTILGGRFPSLFIYLNSVNSPYAGAGQVYTPRSVPSGWKLIQGGVTTSTSSKDSSETPAGSAGGDGNYDNDTDKDDFPDSDQFAVDVFNTGLVTCFNPSKNELIDFADFLYSDSMTEQIAQKLKYLVDSPLDYIIGLNQAHFTPTKDGTQTINLGGVSTNVEAAVVSPQFQFIDCGEVNIADQIKSFLDYEGSRIRLYLPYCGTHELSIHECMGGKIWIQYVIDCLSGSCTAIVKVTRKRDYVYDDPDFDHQMYFFTGNCFTQIPLTARDYNNILNGLFQIAGGCATLPSNPAGGVMNIAQGALNMNKADVTRIGNYSSNYGYMQKQKPFVILERPMPSTPSGYEDRYGRPLHDYLKVSKCFGYTEIDDSTLQTDNFEFMTEEEQVMLKAAISNGIILDDDAAYTGFVPQ